MDARLYTAVLLGLIAGVTVCQAGCVKNAEPTPAVVSQVPNPALEPSPQLRKLVEQKCTALIRPQLLEPNKIRAIDVSHKVQPDHHFVATYCMEAGDGDGGFVNVEARCFYDMSGRITDRPVVNDDPSIVMAICNR